MISHLTFSFSFPFCNKNNMHSKWTLKIETGDCTKKVTHCVLRVKAALVIEEGRLRPFVISRHNFLLITSTKPPFDTTSLNNSYKSSVCLAMIGILFTGDPENKRTRVLSHANARDNVRYVIWSPTQSRLEKTNTGSINIKEWACSSATILWQSAKYY